tara:strand:- start:24436 stop:25002 length:567 start_codon:yes stop_codon:yes gene_type:complete
MATWKEIVLNGDSYTSTYFTHMAGRYSLREDITSLIYPQNSYFVTSNTSIETEDIPFSVHSCRDGFGTQTLKSISVIYSTTSSVGVGAAIDFKFKKLEDSEWTGNTSDNTTHDLVDVWDFSYSGLSGPNTNKIQKYQGIGGSLTNSEFAEGDQLHLLVKASHNTMIGGTTRYYNISVTCEWSFQATLE